MSEEAKRKGTGRKRARKKAPRKKTAPESEAAAGPLDADSSARVPDVEAAPELFPVLPEPPPDAFPEMLQETPVPEADERPAEPPAVAPASEPERVDGAAPNRTDGDHPFESSRNRRRSGRGRGQGQGQGGRNPSAEPNQGNPPNQPGAQEPRHRVYPKTTVPPAKIREGVKRARQEIIAILDEVTNISSDDQFFVKEIELTLGFDEHGNFLGIGTGGAASVKILLSPDDL